MQTLSRAASSSGCVRRRTSRCCEPPLAVRVNRFGLVFFIGLWSAVAELFR